MTGVDMAHEYADSLRQKLGSSLKSVILFGSQARGDATDASDFDLVVVLEKRTKAAREAVLDVGVDMLNRHDRLFAALVYGEEEWQATRRFPLGWNIEREGIAV
jgi:uncharacterized protein